MKRLLFAMLATVAIPGFAQTELRLLNGWDTRFPGTPLIVDPFVANVAKASANKYRVRVSGPEVVQPFEQFQPVSRGAFDLLHTTTPYHAGQSTVGFGLFNYEPDVAAWRQAGAWDLLDRDYQSHNLKLLAIVLHQRPGNGGNHILLKEPLGAAKDLKGRKIRGIRGNFTPVIEGFGGTSVVLAGGEIYSAIQKGTIDGAAWPVLGAVDFKWYEVAKYMTRPTFAFTLSLLLMNHDKFKALPEADRKMLLDEGARIEIAGRDAMDKRQGEEIDELKRRGVQETLFDPAELAKVMRQRVDALWQVAEAHAPSAPAARELRALGKKAGFEK